MGVNCAQRSIKMGISTINEKKLSTSDEVQKLARGDKIQTAHVNKRWNLKQHKNIDYIKT